MKSDVPADRLLVWSVTEGGSRCAGSLRSDVPDAPFPHLNDSKMFIDRVIDGSLAVLQSWRAAELEPSPQPRVTRRRSPWRGS